MSLTNNHHKLPVLAPSKSTTGGSYFISNYPPFSFWSASALPAVEERLDRRERIPPALGLYVHIPFCRKRCDFCYFKVYTNKNSKEIRRYTDAVIAELALLCEREYLADRKPEFVYFGGGTPSYLSAKQLTYLFAEIQRYLPWDAAQEVAFECEPGTLQESKLTALASLGVTRLSLGVENFDPEILSINNRAHDAKAVDRAYDFARRAGFEQINIDLIAGMIGETDANWQQCIAKTIAMKPDSITVYQMEVPRNTTLFRRLRDSGDEAAPVADWATKRRWVDEAFCAFEQAGYTICSAYTAVARPEIRFLYRDALWSGADMLGIGVSSFSHMGGIHYQNESQFDDYVKAVEAGRLPLRRAMVPTDEERMIREFVLQMKLGHIEVDYFVKRFDVDPRKRFKEQIDERVRQGLFRVENGTIRTTRRGLLMVDELLQDFFLPHHRPVLQD